MCLPLVSCQMTLPEDVSNNMTSIPAVVDYNFHVKPILSDRCFKCHGPDANQRKGDLRLDRSVDAYARASNESSRALDIIHPGNLRKSEFVSRILSDDPQYMMPTPESNLKLDDREKAILIRWIEQGAEYKKHWSFVPPQKTEVPYLSDDQWSINDIDRYILKEINAQGLKPSEGAKGDLLLRRVALDLTGLPPSIEEQAKFLTNDQLAVDLEAVVDYYLNQPQFGEKMALEWMDVGRYADSHGYQDDGMRNTWPWRDWVIRQFNDNLPYDTFLLWQLAGDLLPNPTEDQLLATCFNRNHPQTQEGGVVDEEYRVEYVADRTNTLGKGLLGLTLECARCHDHKYDPISQKDYYSLYAFFNNNNDAGIVPYNGEASPTIILASEGSKSRLADLHRKIALLEDTLSRTDEFIDQFENWWSKQPDVKQTVVAELPGMVADFSFEKEFRQEQHTINLDNKPSKNRKTGTKPVFVYTYENRIKKRPDAQNWGHPDDRPKIIETGHIGRAIQFNGDAGIRFNRDLDYDRDQPFSVSVWVKFLKPGEEGPIFGKTNGDFEGYRGWLCKLNGDGTLSFQLNHVWPDNSIDFQTTESVPVNQWLHIVMTYDGSSRAKGVNFYIDGVEPEFILHSDRLHKSLLHGVKGSNWSNQPFLVGMELRKSMENMQMDELKIFDRQLVPLEVKFLYSGKIPEAVRKEEWFGYYLASGKNANYQRLKSHLQQMRCEENLLMTDQPEVMIMREKKFARNTFILNRGAYDAPGDPVVPAIPEAFQSGEELSSSDRLGLAKWVISPANPLTARVQVNRLWMQCFGRGLVPTQEDFGSQGGLPTHPELLDYLATRFIELDWDIKALLREIVLSATYRQQSVPDTLTLNVDPENKYYSYYPAHRLSAEIIRDEALAGSGLLVKEIGGPSVYPYQPEGIWEALATRNATKYQQQSGDSLYRRSLYTVWKRSSPPPAMLNFDAPDRYYCVVRRQNTSTPLQALVLMNDPQFIEAARVLGEKMSSKSTIEEAIGYAFNSLLSRQPREDEIKSMKDMWHEMANAFTSNASNPNEILKIGDSKYNTSLNIDSLAAHTLVASAIMNYDEFVIKR